MLSSNPVALSVTSLQQPLHLFVHDANDMVISRRLREEGVWEPYETSLILALLKPGDVFVDVGANLGYFSLLGATCTGPQGRVFAFEPDPANFALLQRNINHNQLQHCIQPVPVALNSSSEEGRLFLSKDNFGDHQIHSGSEERKSVAIELRNGTDYLAPRLSRMDLLKIDTQGAEYAVVAGLMPLLQALPEMPRILIELTPLSLRQAGASGRQLIELLSQLQQPFWIVDHIEHALVASEASELAQWCDNVDAVPGDAGFMNILLGGDLPALS